MEYWPLYGNNGGVQVNPVLLLPQPLLVPLHQVVLAPVLAGCPLAGLIEIVTLSMVGCVPPVQWASPWTTTFDPETVGTSVVSTLDAANAGAGVASTAATATDTHAMNRLM
jgi:hypothetical protein